MLSKYIQRSLEVAAKIAGMNAALCRLLGHKRGKLIMVVNTAAVPTNTYQCPRCFSTWTRKQRRKG